MTSKFIAGLILIELLCVLFLYGCKPTDNNGWHEGEFVTFRKQLPHAGCKGFLTFNGQSKPAPYSETERFYTHVCDKCSTTNSILNETWPKMRREWRDR